MTASVAAPEVVQPQPIVLGQALTPSAPAGPAFVARSWPWLAAILAGFAAALALAWTLRPRRASPSREAEFIPAPRAANDVAAPRRVFRRSEPPPPRVTILAR